MFQSEMKYKIVEKGGKKNSKPFFQSHFNNEKR